MTRIRRFGAAAVSRRSGPGFPGFASTHVVAVVVVAHVAHILPPIVIVVVVVVIVVVVGVIVIAAPVQLVTAVLNAVTSLRLPGQRSLALAGIVRVLRNAVVLVVDII